MSHRLLQKYLDDIINTPIPPDVFAREQEPELDYVQRVGKSLDEEFKFHPAEQHAATAQRLKNVVHTIAEIAQIVPFTIEGILSGKILPLLDPLGQRDKLLLDSLTHTIGLAAIDAYLDRNPKAVDELIPILPPGQENSLPCSETDQDKKDDVKWRLINLMQDKGWDEKIKAWLQSTTDSSKESPPMPSGSSRKK